MKNQKWLILVVALVLMMGTAGVLDWLKGRQQLGQPGVMAARIPGSVAMKIDLPEHVLDFTSTNMPESKLERDFFPEDSSYAHRRYFSATDDFNIDTTVILMGTDRTSIHRPDYCLAGQGFVVDEKEVVNIPFEGPEPCQLPVEKWKFGGLLQQSDGRKAKVGGVYVFWYVADNEWTTSHGHLQGSLVKNLLLHGILQRWANISYISFCAPGQEEATFERMKKFIAASAPQYLLIPKGKNTVPTGH